MSLEELARTYHALESVDANDFQRRARILQSIWREQNGWEPAEYRGKLRGARIRMPFGREKLANFLDDEIREVVRREVLDDDNSRGKLYGTPRIFNNLLSSQPLCFNLFAHLQRDTDLAGRVFRQLTDGRVEAVDRVRFEHSPGRGDPDYTGDRSAFDVFAETRTADGGNGFVGIEVKYHENLKGSAEQATPRYCELTEAMDCFVDDAVERVAKPGLSQIWRDHLLAGSMLLTDDYDDGFFVFLAPEGNAFCSEAVGEYRTLLTDGSTFDAWSLEDVVEAIEAESEAEWIDAFRRRYLEFGRIDEALARD